MGNVNPTLFRSGPELLHNPLLNKGTAFSLEERDALSLRGLLPPRVITMQEQVQRVLENLRGKPNDLDKYVSLIALQDRNETLFYRIILDHLDEMMPIIYTPTVGLACQEYGQIFRRPRGIFISSNDAGRVARNLANWPLKDVRVIVVTDGERILGLGDLGANGMGIPVGKLSLYTACAGIHPSACLPITIDVGTENERLLKHPLYIGLQQRRLRGEAYDALIAEFVEAVQSLFPDALIQFEDFANHNAFRILNKYRNSVRTFNDDIQGTAAVAMAGIYSSLRITGRALADQRLLFFGAGEAGMGIAGLVVSALMEAGLTADEARKRCWFIDSKGLVVQSRTDLTDHKRTFAQDAAQNSDPLEVLDALRPTVLIGASGMPGTFTAPILRKMADINERPVVFALSNPTSKSECTAEEAYTHTNGRAVFASGSPYKPVNFEGKTFVPGQGNNAYIFPGVGLGVIASGSRLVTDEMFLSAAKVLASALSESELATGRIYPPFTRVREVSTAIALVVAGIAYDQGLAAGPRPADLEAAVRNLMFEPVYNSYV